VILKLK